MQRDAKFGYGFLLGGVGVLYLVEKIFGTLAAAIFAAVCLVVGVGFLVAAHRHREKEQTFKPRRGLMTTIGLYAVIGAASGFLGGGLIGGIKGLMEKLVEPPIEWPIPEPINYGTPLSTIQLNATAPVPGVFEYHPDIGAILQVGTHSLTVNFAPSDSKKYSSTSKSVSLVVNPAPTSKAIDRVNHDKSGDVKEKPCSTGRPRAGSGPEAYKDICNEDLGKWLVEEAKKISDLADKHMNAKNPENLKAEQFFFFNEYRACCSQEVPALREEALRRLGPSAKSPKGEEAWEMLSRQWREAEHTGIMSPMFVYEYAPYLKKLGVQLQRNGTSREGPSDLPFVQNFGTPPDKKFPYGVLVEVQIDRELTGGYLVVEFNRDWAMNGSDLQDGQDLDLSEYKELDKYWHEHFVSSHLRHIDHLKKGAVVHVTAVSNAEIRATKAMYWPE